MSLWNIAVKFYTNVVTVLIQYPTIPNQIGKSSRLKHVEAASTPGKGRRAALGCSSEEGGGRSRGRQCFIFRLGNGCTELDILSFYSFCVSEVFHRKF